jgi:beta-lactamase regulating signal transducer with metallopeptidase domain
MTLPAIDLLAKPGVSSGEPSNTRSGTPVTVRQLAGGVWFAGALMGLAVLATGLWRLRRLASHSRTIGGMWKEQTERISEEYALQRPVQLLQSRNPSVLVTWGVTRPKVILPDGAAQWPDDVANIVLRHELAHIRRRDWVAQMIAQWIRIIYWFNPLTWIVCRRLRLEAELACDDAVLVRNINGHEYASHLLGLARSLNTTDRAWSAVLTMARPSTLERRFAAMLNPEVNRNPLTRSAVLVTLLIGLCIIPMLPAMKTFATASPAPLQAAVEAVNPVLAAPAPQEPPPAAPRVNTQLLGYEAELSKWLGQTPSETAEIRKAIREASLEIKSFQDKENNLPSGESVGMLIKLYDTSSDANMKEHILNYLALSSNPQAVEKMLAIARNDADKEMQEQALNWVAMRPNSFDTLVSLFDASRDPNRRRHILDLLGMSSDPRATQKLFSIAQSDPDPELRRTAVDYIAFR